MSRKTQVLGAVLLAGGIGVIGLINREYLFYGYYAGIDTINGAIKVITTQKKSNISKQDNRKSVVILNTGSTYYCGQAGVAKTRSYLNNLLTDGWSIENSEISTFASSRIGSVGRPCSFSYYVMKK